MNTMYRSMQSVLFECSNLNIEGREMVKAMHAQGFVSWNVSACSGERGRCGLMGITSLMVGYVEMC